MIAADTLILNYFYQKIFDAIFLYNSKCFDNVKLSFCEILKNWLFKLFPNSVGFLKFSIIQRVLIIHIKQIFNDKLKELVAIPIL